MVEAGFNTIDEKSKPIKGFTPPGLWRQFPNEWLFAYTRPGASRTFLLRCSLQDATKKMFIHASELDLEHMPKHDNIQVLGLLMLNYVDPEKCDSISWDGVVQNEEAMADMFAQYITGPLWEAAAKEPGYDEAGQSSGGKFKWGLYKDWLSVGMSPRQLQENIEERITPILNDKKDRLIVGAISVALLASVAAVYLMRRR